MALNFIGCDRDQVFLMPTFPLNSPLTFDISGQPEHLGGDAVEEQRVAILVTALQVEDPGHQALL
jgi:hypothetical protein